MKMALMVIVIFVLTLVIRLWIVEEEGLEAPMTQLDVGHVIKSDMLLPHVTL